MNKNTKVIQCKNCNEKHITNHSFKYFCSKKCRNTWYANQDHKKKVFDLPSGTVGTLSELMVILDLLKKGYEVYRPITPNCSGDILIEKDKEKKFIKIEVRTSYKSPMSGKFLFPNKNIHSDILALVIHRNNEIVYLSYPSLEIIKI